VRDYRNTARAVGALFIVGTVAGLIGLGVFQEPVVGGDDYLVEASRQADRLATGAVLELAMGAALVAMAIVIYPVLREHSETLAIGYVVPRSIEGVLYLIDTVLMLTLITVSRSALDAGSGSMASFDAIGTSLIGARDWLGHGVLDATAFGLSALVLNAALLRGRLVPSWLSLWGLGGAVLYVAAGVLVIFGLEPLSSTQVALEAPLGLQEMGLALWLIIRGFSRTEVPAARATAPAPA